MIRYEVKLRILLIALKYREKSMPISYLCGYIYIYRKLTLQFIR